MNPPSRLRDPLGFAKVASDLADLLAPEITSRQYDARWLSILCWSIQRVNESLPKISTTEQRYDRLRGLELRWVIEACCLKNEGRGRQLPGGRTVRLLNKNLLHLSTIRQKMGEAQWKRYRSAGPYSAYRGMLHSLDLVADDGWTLREDGEALASVAAANLTPSAVISISRVVNGNEKSNWVKFWLLRWPLRKEPPQAASFLPTARALKLTPGEIRVISPLLFSAADSRTAVAKSVGRSNASSHADLCKELQHDLLKEKKWRPDEIRKLKKLAAFSRLADAAVESLSAAFVASSARTKMDIVVGDTTVKFWLEELRAACKTWSSVKADQVVDYRIVDDFAEAIASAKTLKTVLVELIRFHEEHAGGVRWLRIEGDTIDKIARRKKPPYSFYRFRLAQLARLARGCALITGLPPCLDSAAEITSEDEENE